MSAPESNPDLLAQLIDEWQERLRRGERLDVEEYAKKHPDLADEIRQLLPGLAALENLKGDALDHTIIAPTAGLPIVEGAPVLDRLGDFRILREVGRGGMGVVYEAEQVSLGRRVALKVLPQKVILDSRQKRRFEREARAAAKLHHTNIVPVFGVGEYEGMPYYVMQFIQGLGLDSVSDEIKQMQGVSAPRPVSPDDMATVSRRDISAADVARSLMTGQFQGGVESDLDSDPTPVRPATPATKAPSSATTLGSGTFTASLPSMSLPGRDTGRVRLKRQTYWQSIAALGTQIADALEHAHSQGILHRDIKPSNLLLDTRGTVWVTDFGLAKATDNQDDLTHTGDILGTLRYMPPEAFEGKSDARGDIYSLGLTLYELLALRPAFGEKDRHQLIRQVTTSEPEPLGRLNPAIPRDLATIIHKAIEREPARRYQTARELADDLDRFLANEPILARQTGPWERALRWVRKKPAAAALVGVSAVAAVAIAAAVAVLLYNAELQDAKHAADQARTDAEQAHDAEVGQRQQAEIARQQSEIARGEALKQHDLAEIARGEAVKLREVAETERENAILQRGLLAVLTQQWPEAVADLGAYTKKHPTDLKAWLGLSKAQARLGKTQESIEGYTRAIVLAQPDKLEALVEGHIGRAEQESSRGKLGAAIADYERAFKLKPDQPEYAGLFARTLYEDSAGWRVLQPTKLTTKAGALRALPDGSIVPDGFTLDSDTFTIEAATELNDIRAIRLETLPRNRDGESEPGDRQRPNSYHGGFFMLTEFTLAAAGPKTPSRPFAFNRVWADFFYPYHSYSPPNYDRSDRITGQISAAIDGDPKTGWYVFNQVGAAHSAVFVTPEPASGPGGATLTIQLKFPGTAHARQSAIGRFRLSVCAAPPEPGYECAMISPAVTGWMKLAAARHQRGDSTGALDALGRAEREPGGDDIAKQLLRSIIYDAPAQKPEALAAYEKAIERVKRNTYGYTYDQTMRWLTVAASSRWIEREPANPIYRRNRVETLILLDNWTQAIADYDRLIASEPGDHRLLLDRGDCHARTGQIDKARADFAAAARLNAEDTLSGHQQKLAALTFAFPLAAIAHLDAAIALEKGKPTEADFLIRRARILEQQGRKDEARADFTRALEVNPNSADALLERGGFRIASGERAAGLADYVAARKLSPSAALSWHSQRVNQYEYGAKVNVDLSLIHLGEMIESELTPANRNQYLSRRSSLLHREKRWAEAAADYSRILETNPKMIVYWVERAECHALAGEREKAVAGLAEALKIDRPQTLQGMRAKVQLHERTRNWAIACVYLDAWLGLKLPAKEEVALLRQRAAARIELGQHVAAVADSDRILALQPDDAEAGRIRTRCLVIQADELQFQGKSAEAAENRRKARELYEKGLKDLPKTESAPTALALANLLLSEIADWQILDPLQLKSVGGATLTRQTDGSILAAGINPTSDTYIVASRTAVTGIRAFRLEAMPDASLPLSGPGRAANGNFVMAEFAIRTGKQPIPLDRAAASVETRGIAFYPVRDVIDGRRETVWGILQQPGQLQSIGQLQTAVFTVPNPIAGTVDGADYTFTLQFGHATSEGRNLGRFRLAVSSSDRAMHVEQIRMSSANGWVKLAAARALRGEREAAEAALQTVEGKPVAADGASLILIAWVWEVNGPGESAKAARDRVVAWLKNKTESLLLPMPSIALEVLTRAEADAQAEAGEIALWRARTSDHLGDARESIIHFGHAIDAKPDARGVYLERGRVFLRLQEWKKAAADFQKAIELNPDDHFLWFTTCALLVWSGDEEGYSRHREAMLKRFGDTLDPTLAERTTKGCSLRPVSPEEAKLLVALGQRAVSADNQSGLRHWYHLAHAMANYRAGNADAAIEQGRLALDLELTYRSIHVRAAARLVQALAHHKLGQPNDARRLLAEAEEIISRELPDIDQSHPDSNFHDLLTCHLLQQEAAKAIAPHSRPRAPAPREVHSVERAVGDKKR